MLQKTITSIGTNPRKRRLAIAKDDPFLNIFMQQTQVNISGTSTISTADNTSNLRSRSLTTKITGLMTRSRMCTGMNGSVMSDSSIPYEANADEKDDPSDESIETFSSSEESDISSSKSSKKSRKF